MVGAGDDMTFDRLRSPHRTATRSGIDAAAAQRKGPVAWCGTEQAAVDHLDVGGLLRSRHARFEVERHRMRRGAAGRHDNPIAQPNTRRKKAGRVALDVELRYERESR